MNLIIVSVIVFLVPPATLLDIEFGKSVVWGPGLGESSLPVRYFFVQFVNSAGEKYENGKSYFALFILLFYCFQSVPQYLRELSWMSS